MKNVREVQVGERMIRKYGIAGDYQSSKDYLAREAPLQLSIRQGHQQRQVSITMRTPGDDEALALGFLITEGILSPSQDLGEWRINHLDEGKNHLCLELPLALKIDWKRLSRQTYTSSSCGVCGKTSIEQVYTKVPWVDDGNDFVLSHQFITTLPDRLRDNQQMFIATGGNHGCTLIDLENDSVVFAEDVGRHNALDKLIGKLWMSKRLPCNQHVLVLSGRASFELVQKAGMAGIKCIVAVGAPSTLAADLAEELDITLCGFVKRHGFNVYSGYHRILS